MLKDGGAARELGATTIVSTESDFRLPKKKQPKFGAGWSCLYALITGDTGLWNCQKPGKWATDWGTSIEGKCESLASCVTSIRDGQTGWCARSCWLHQAPCSHDMFLHVRWNVRSLLGICYTCLGSTHADIYGVCLVRTCFHGFLVIAKNWFLPCF